MHKLIKMQKSGRTDDDSQSQKTQPPKSYAFQFNFAFFACHFLYHLKHAFPDSDADVHFLVEKKKHFFKATTCSQTPYTTHQHFVYCARYHTHTHTSYRLCITEHNQAHILTHFRLFIYSPFLHGTFQLYYIYHNNVNL